MAHDVLYNRRPYSRMYDPVAPLLLDDDLSFGNLETVVDPSLPYENYPAFNVHPEYVQAVVDAGIDIFSLANNHANDWGAQGIIATQISLDSLQTGSAVGYSGLRLHAEEPMEFTEIVIEGWRIGFIAVAGFLNSPVARDLVYYVPYADAQIADEFLRQIREAQNRYDLVIVSYHGGVEYQTEMDPEKHAFFRDMADAGADIVWGHHPHVLQPWEIVEYGTSRRLILGSLGNFISGQTWKLDPADPDASRVATGDSAILRVDIGLRGGYATVVSARAVGTSNYWHETNFVEIDLLDRLSDGDLPDAWNTFFTARKMFVEGLVGTPNLVGFEALNQ